MRALGRSAVRAQRGLVSSDHPLASAAGLHILRKGGNAMDAAVCVAATLSVLVPMMTGLGGDLFILYYEAAERHVHALLGSGGAATRASREFFVARNYRTIPLRGMLAPSVPGAVDAMAVALDRWGSGRWRLARLLEPAIHYAEAGFPVTDEVATWLQNTASILTQYPSSVRAYFPEGRPPRVGEILVQADLGRSLRTIAAEGARAFYEGAIAQQVADYVESHGGLLSIRDLSAHRSEIVEAPRTTYRGLTVLTTPPPSQGFLLLEMLNLLEHDDLEGLEPLSTEVVHLGVEAKKLSFADRLAYVADPRFVTDHLGHLLRKEYARDRRRALDLRRAGDIVAPGALREQLGETTAFVVADGHGNVAACIASLYEGFGCGEVVEGTGILLNNRGAGFSLVSGHPNIIAPGKRTMHTLMTFIALRDGRPVLAWATRGGDSQAPWNFQVFSHIVHHGMNPQEAIEQPKWSSVPASDPWTVDDPFEVRMEAGFPDSTYEGLRALGHRVVVPYPNMSGSQIVQIDQERGVYTGGSDPRADGCATGF